MFELSGERENYRGYEVDLIDAGNQYLQFKNGVSLSVGVTMFMALMSGLWALRSLRLIEPVALLR